MRQRDETNTAGTAGKAALSTLPDLYDSAVGTHQQSVFMRKHHPWGYQSITYREFGALISYIGAGLLGAGLQRGDRVALIADNCPEWVLVYAAVTSCGAAIVPLDPETPGNEIHHLLIDCEASFIIAAPRIYSESIEERRLGKVKAIVIGERDPALGATTLGEIMAAGKAAVGGGEASFFNTRAQTTPEDIAVVAYTAGTSGRPKGVLLQHSNLLAALEALGSRLALRQGDVLLAVPPLHQAFAAMINILAALRRGATTAFARSSKPRIILEDIRTERVTVLAAAPRLLGQIAAFAQGAGGRAREARKPGLPARLLGAIRRLYEAILRLFGAGARRRRFPPDSPAASLAGLRLCISSAAPLRPDIERTLAAAGPTVLQGYGLTEASALVSLSSPDRPRPGTAGPALSGLEVSIENPDGEGTGEIVVRGPAVMKEYLKNPGATAAALRGGALFTGDLGRIDRNGYLTVVGQRRSVIAAAGGKNVYPEEIEALLGTSPMILECIVVPVRGRTGGVRPGAVIVPDYDALASQPGVSGPRSEERIREIIAAEIENLCAALPDYKHIAELRIRDSELPKTSSGRLKRHLVQWNEE